MKKRIFAENVRKTAVVLLICFTLIAPAVCAAQPPIGRTPPDVPGIPEPPPGVLAHNFTDMVPRGHVQQLERGVPIVLNFKNMRLGVNASQNLKLNMTVGGEVAMHYLTLDLKPSESLELNINVDVKPPRNITRPLDGRDFYLTVEPNATDPVNSTLKLYINEDSLENETGRDIHPWALSWGFWNGTEWETVKSWLDEEGYLVANTSHFSTWTIRETGRPTQPPNIPGLPPVAEAHDYSDVVPRGFTWRVRSREPMVLVFRNVTMVFNSSRGLGLNITTGHQVAGHVFGLDLVPGESLRLDINLDVQPPSGVTRMSRDIGVYVEVEPNATVAVDANLKLLINETELEARLGRGIDVSKLTWAYWKDGDWVPVESVIDENGYLNARTSHFSVWTIAEVPKVPLPTPVAPPDIPGVPGDAVAFEFLETVPTGFSWKAEAGKATILSFKNFKLMVAPSKSLDLDISVGSDVANQLLSLQLAPGESLSLDIDVASDAPSGVEKASGDIGVYLEVESNSTAPMEATLSLLIEKASLESRLGRAVDVAKLSWAYWDGDAWALVESAMDENGFLNAETDHFSSWTVVEVAEPAPPPQPGTPWTLYGGVLVIAVIALALIYRKVS